MALSDRINDKFQEWAGDISSGLARFMVTVFGKGIELTLDIVGKALKPALMPTIDKLLAQPNLPPEVKNILTQIKTTDGQWQAIVQGSLAGSAIGGASSAMFGPMFRWINNQIEETIHSQIFDYPIILAAWLRGLDLPEGIWKDLNMFGYREDRQELLRKLVWLRLDPAIVQQIWLRDKSQYEHLWKDLHDIGWDDERIDVYKTLAQLIPGAADLIRMAVREVFTPEIVEKYGQMEDFPPDFAAWGAKVGLTEEWAKNYWAAHWDLPSATQGFEMLHRGVITYDELKVLLRALDVMPYWRDKLIEIAYSPYTRVDIRRMYKVAVLDEAGVKKAYMDLGYNEERAQALTEFTLKTYARPEDAVEDEEEKIRDLTRSDICDGYRRGIFTAAEAGELLAKLAYTPESVQFYLDREDLKKDQALKDAYATNYRQLFVIGLKDADTVRSEMVELGFLPGEVDEYLRLWYIEKLRRQAKPSRTDLARFLKKGIITENTWRQSMADLGYADKYIDWYRAEMEE
jgi:hypothetical protein